jgi:hypothetical protein
MRIALVTTAVLLALIAVAPPVSAAGAQAMVQKQAFGRAHVLVEKAGWRRRWHRRHRWHHRRYHRGYPYVYGYYYRPYGRWHRGWMHPWYRWHRHRWNRHY